MEEESVFLEALQKTSPAARGAFLDEACEGNLSLRDGVDMLLKAHEKAGGFLQGEPPGLSPTIDQPITERPGTVIGRYKLLEQIGEGGFGVVFMAEQEEPVRRKVALKVIKPGMDTKEVIARFEAERQALAMMDHPNIAKVLDAGATESGRPYFVMELVRGIPITEYCDQHNVASRERLELFTVVCQAVQHAHQKGIIHRDIKPTNVMVTLHDDKPVPKVIDFGVAKATNARLTERTLFTHFAQMVGTPLYMSPEQTRISGLDIDTRSDIYSLGVLLYELLTGTTPLDRNRIREAAYDELLHIIREEEPPKPSTRISSLGDTATTVSIHRKTDPRHLSQFLRGDLDWIVMRALEKDRTRRYETASGFAADIQRYLNDEPVNACPPSATYRFRKFAQRNKVTLATASMVALALLLGMIGTAWQAVRATQAEGVANSERDIAETERNHAIEAKQLADNRLQRAVKAEQGARESSRQAEDRSREITRLLASSYVDRAQALCEQGETGRGMLWFARSLRSSPEDAKDLEQVIRTNLATWRRRMPMLQAVLQHSGQVSSLHYAPDGAHAVTATRRSHSKGITATTQIWDTVTWKPVGEPVRYEGIMRTATFTDHGPRVVTQTNQGEVQVWDGTTGRSIGQPLVHPAGPIWAVAFNSDASRVLTGSADGTARLWDTETGDPLGEYLKHSGRVMAVAFSPDGSYFLTGVEDGTVWLWDASSGEQIRELPQSNRRLEVIACSPDGSRIATAGGDVIEVWDAETGESTCPAMLHGAIVYSLAFSADGSRIASGGNERAARIWDASNGQPVGVPMRHRGTVYDLAFSPDGRNLLTGSEDGTARVWDVPSRGARAQQLVHNGNTVLGAAYGPRGLCVATKGGGAWQVREHRSGQLLGKLLPDRNQVGTRLRLAADGSRLLLQSSSGGELWDIGTGELVGKSSRFESVRTAIFSPESSRILEGSGGSRNAAQLRDALTRQPLGRPLIHQDSVHCLAFNADGSQILTGSYAGTTRIWDAATLKPLGEPLHHPSEVKSLAWSPDGKRILTGFADWTIRLWNRATMEPIGEPLHHQNIVCSLAFSPNGSRFLSCSLDQTLRFWDASTLKPIGPPLRHSGRWPDVSFRSDGTQILVADETGNNQIFDAPPGPVEGDRERIVLWVQVVTGLQLDRDGGIGVLDGSTWQDLSQQLRELGGPPTIASLSPPPITVETDFSRAISLAHAGLHHAEQAQWDESVAKFTKAIELSQQSCTLQTQIAAWCEQLAAEWEYEEDGPLEPLLRFTIGLYEDLADHADVSDYREKLSSSYLRLSHKLRKAGRTAEALETDRQVLDLHPGTLKDRFKKGKAYTNRGIGQKQNFGREQVAEGCFTIATFLLQTVIDEIGDESKFRWHLARCHALIGQIRALQGRGHEAFSEYQTSLATLPEYAMAHTYLAELLLASPDQDIRDEAQALVHAKRARELLEPENPWHNYVSRTLGRAYYRTGNFTAAIEELQRKRPIAPFAGSRNALFLAMAHERLGDHQAALRHYRRATHLAELYTIANGELRNLIAEAAELLGVAKHEAATSDSSPPTGNLRDNEVDVRPPDRTS